MMEIWLISFSGNGYDFGGDDDLLYVGGVIIG